MGDRRPLTERFWCRVTVADGCWLWHGAHQPDGRGVLGMNGKLQSAPRVSWHLHYGDIPVGMHVLHQCDNPPCVNPAHLFLGTNLDNIRDAQKKGRLRGSNGHLCGDNSASAKLTWNDVDEIRNSVEILRVLAARYGVSISTIHLIRKRKIWTRRTEMIDRAVSVMREVL
jgi:hypothetical protein